MKSDREHAIREENARLYLIKLGEFLQLMAVIPAINVGNLLSRPSIENKILNEHDSRHQLGDRGQIAKEYQPYLEIFNNDQLSAADKIEMMQKYANQKGGESLGSLSIHTIVCRMDLANKQVSIFDPPDKKLKDTNVALQYLIDIAVKVKDAKQSIADHAAQQRAQKSQSESAVIRANERVPVPPRAAQSAPAKVKLSQEQMDQRYGERAQQYLQKLGELLAIISEIPHVEVGIGVENRLLKTHDERQQLGDKSQIAKTYKPYLDVINDDHLSPVQKVVAMRKIAIAKIEAQRDPLIFDVVLSRIDLTNRRKMHFEPEDKNLNETNHNVSYLIEIAENVLRAKQHQARAPVKAKSDPGPSAAGLYGRKPVRAAKSDPGPQQPEMGDPKAPKRKF